MCDGVEPKCQLAFWAVGLTLGPKSLYYTACIFINFYIQNDVKMKVIKKMFEIEPWTQES